MPKIIYKQDGEGHKLDHLLEGYLYGLGEVCHFLFGPQGEEAIYEAIGSYFLRYLEKKMNITFRDRDPWKRYCHIIEVFTKYGFYTYVELEEWTDGRYWMLESGQYAGAVWEDQKSWERGTPPCPLWSILLHSLAEIGYTIVLDSVKFDQSLDGYESTFHFKKLTRTDDGVLEKARKGIRGALFPICSNCKKIRDDDGHWKDVAEYFRDNFDADFSHTICSVCVENLYPDYNNRIRAKTSESKY